MLAPYVRPGMKILDLGCAMGYFTMDLAFLAGKWGRVWAVDIDKRMLNAVRIRAKQNGLRQRIILRQVDPGTPELPANMDFILTFWVLHEVPDPGFLLKLCKKALSPNGNMLIVEPLVHVSGKKFDELIQLAQKAGFESIQIRHIPLSRAVVLA
jgi:2-polyprenyl-3-methyl-5-hydroxy-6-metoxy-1,4-benzoquinol methylase